MKFTKYHLPLVLYAALIIIISSISHLKQPQLKFFSVDKLAHFIEYSLLALLTYRSFSHFSSKVSVFQALIRSVGFVTLFALLDEFYQRYIPGRFFDYYDIMSGLKVQTIKTIDSSKGEATTVTSYSDYKVIQGVKVPFLTMVSGEQNMELKIESIEINTDLSDKYFN